MNRSVGNWDDDDEDDTEDKNAIDKFRNTAITKADSGVSDREPPGTSLATTVYATLDKCNDALNKYNDTLERHERIYLSLNTIEKELDDILNIATSLKQDFEKILHAINEDVDGVRTMMVSFSENTQIANMSDEEWLKKSMKDQHEILDTRLLILYFVNSVSSISPAGVKLFETETWDDRWSTRFSDCTVHDV
jgi:hypothetical protein